MKLSQIINNIPVLQVTGDIIDADITGIFYDSRRVVKGSIFIAIKGFKVDGHNFITDVINREAAVVVLENDLVVPEKIFEINKVVKILVADSRKALAEISHKFFNEPSKKLKLIGVTGTNGKTTTTYIIKNLFEKAGEETGLIGTISNYIGQKKIKSSLTTPESSDLNELLFNMYEKGCQSAIMEVSSHSLALKRVYGLNFRSAVFTNITSDHLDFHETFENYFDSKKILFDSLSPEAFSIYNIDDTHGKEIVSNTNSKVYSYGISSDADFRIKDVSYDLSGTEFKILFREKDYNISIPLIGEFNAYNACAAFAVGILSGIDSNIILDSMKNLNQIPGRFELIGRGEKKVIVDYSHTADSLLKALTTIRNIVGNDYPVYTVFGCGGDRDKTKRPMMGKIATELSKKVFITSDNPRSEDPFSIINEIKTGIKKSNYEVIENRELAIKAAIETTEENAVILVAGKGHEDYQEIKGVKNHFSDLETAEKYLNK